eukprot:4261607-Amphidinium_carterae.1
MKVYENFKELTSKDIAAAIVAAREMGHDAAEDLSDVIVYALDSRLRVLFAQAHGMDWLVVALYEQPAHTHTHISDTKAVSTTSLQSKGNCSRKCHRGQLSTKGHARTRVHARTHTHTLHMRAALFNSMHCFSFVCRMESDWASYPCEQSLPMCMEYRVGACSICLHSHSCH